MDYTKFAELFFGDGRVTIGQEIGDYPDQQLMVVGIVLEANSDLRRSLEYLGLGIPELAKLAEMSNRLLAANISAMAWDVFDEASNEERIADAELGLCEAYDLIAGPSTIAEMLDSGDTDPATTIMREISDAFGSSDPVEVAAALGGLALAVRMLELNHIEHAFAAAAAASKIAAETCMMLSTEKTAASTNARKSVSHRVDQKQQKPHWIEHCRRVKDSGTVISTINDLKDAPGYDYQLLEEVSDKTLKAWAKEGIPGLVFKAGRKKNK